MQSHKLTQTVLDFIQSPYHTLAVFGMTHSGKTNLLHQAADAIRAQGRECVILLPNQRLAVKNDGDSIYNHLYFAASESLEKPESEDFALESPEKTEDSKTDSNIVPLKSNNDPDDCIYLLDEAHLLSNSKITTPDGKQYGSGILLQDFFEFADLEKTKRKILFFGDPFQIQRGDALFRCEQSVCLPLLSHNDPQLSGRLKNAAKLAQAISQQRFAALDLVEDDAFRIRNDKDDADKKAILKELLQQYQMDAESAWYLAETHDKTKKLTDWLRQRLHGKSHPAILETGDLLEIYVHPPLESRDPFAKTVRPNLQTVSAVGPIQPYEQPLKGREPITFHSIPITTDEFSEEQFLLREFLTAEKPELDADIAVAIRVYQQRQEKLSPLTYARYGYAATVHHAQGMKRETCYINCDHSAGRHSEGFFRWLYSALTVSGEQTVLLNFTPIHPFDQAVWKSGTAQQIKPFEQIRIGAGWTWLPENTDTAAEYSLAKHLSCAAAKHGCDTVQMASHPWQEQFRLSHPQEGSFLLRVSYDGKNRVTALHSDCNEGQQPLLRALIRQCLADADYPPNSKMLLEGLLQYSRDGEWQAVSAIPQNEYRLHIVFMCRFDERVAIEINFDKQGLVSSLRPLICSNEELLTSIREQFK